MCMFRSRVIYNGTSKCVRCRSLDVVLARDVCIHLSAFDAAFNPNRWNGLFGFRIDIEHDVSPSIRVICIVLRVYLILLVLFSADNGIVVEIETRFDAQFLVYLINLFK